MMKRRPDLSTLFFAMGVVAFLGAGAALAQTPDGETPAEEDVCDLALLSGAAYGLCNAYCEAMDCHLPDADHPDTYPSASPTACMKVKNNFIKITGMAELPCEASDPCPPGSEGTEGCQCVDDGEDGACDDGLACEGEAPDWTCEVDGGSGN